METGKANEEIILKWLQNRNKSILDFREFRLAQRIDVDFGIETIDGAMLLAEIKSDKWISAKGNLCFENHRINHYAKDNWFYLGWGWRSPAKYLFVRNPKNGETFIFEFERLRSEVGVFIKENAEELEDLRVSNNKKFIKIVPTDSQKTTFNWLIPMNKLHYIFQVINAEQQESN